MERNNNSLRDWLFRNNNNNINTSNSVNNFFNQTNNRVLNIFESENDNTNILRSFESIRNNSNNSTESIVNKTVDYSIFDSDEKTRHATYLKNSFLKNYDLSGDKVPVARKSKGIETLDSSGIDNINNSDVSEEFINNLRSNSNKLVTTKDLSDGVSEIIDEHKNVNLNIMSNFINSNNPENLIMIMRDRLRNFNPEGDLTDITSAFANSFYLALVTTSTGETMTFNEFKKMLYEIHKVFEHIEESNDLTANNYAYRIYRNSFNTIFRHYHQADESILQNNKILSEEKIPELFREVLEKADINEHLSKIDDITENGLTETEQATQKALSTFKEIAKNNKILGSLLTIAGFLISNSEYIGYFINAAHIFLDPKAQAVAKGIFNSFQSSNNIPRNNTNYFPNNNQSYIPNNDNRYRTGARDVYDEFMRFLIECIKDFQEKFKKK